jgi:hypothetical protein
MFFTFVLLFFTLVFLFLGIYFIIWWKKYGKLLFFTLKNLKNTQNLHNLHNINSFERKMGNFNQKINEIVKKIGKK